MNAAIAPRPRLATIIGYSPRTDPTRILPRLAPLQTTRTVNGAALTIDRATNGDIHVIDTVVIPK